MIFLLTKWAKYTFPHTPKGVGPKGGDAKIEEVNTLGQGVVPFLMGRNWRRLHLPPFFF